MKRNKMIAVAVMLLSAGCLPAHAQQDTVAVETNVKLTLDECIAMARSNNRTLQNALLDIQSAKEQQQEAYTKYFPQVKANITAFQAFDDMVRGDILNIIPISEFNRGYGAVLSITEPIYAGGQITTANKLTNVQTEVCELQHALTEKKVVQKVTENYWQIVQIKYNLNTIEAAEKQIASIYKDVNNYVNAGVTTRNSLLKVKMRQKELESARLKLENADHVLRLLLAQQIGAKGTIDVVSDEQRVDAAPLHANTADAVGCREEIALAMKNVEAKQLQVKMERGKLLPTVAVGVLGYHSGFGGLSKVITNTIETTATNGVALATVNIPISDWWGGSHAVKRAKNKVQQAQNDYLDAQEKLFIDIESAWSNLSEAYKQIDIAKATAEEAAENLRMSLVQYKAGTEKISDLLDAETLNRQAQNALSSAIVSYHIRLADYQRKTCK